MKVAKIILTIIIIAVILFFGAMIFVPQFGWGLVFIKSGSMEPVIKTGSGVIIKKQDRYNEGDIITFVNKNGNLVTHRIVKISEDNSKLFKTKGDNNNVVDVWPITEKQIKGRVTVILPYIGYVISFLKSKFGIATLILTLLIYFIGDEIMKSKRIEKKK